MSRTVTAGIYTHSIAGMLPQEAIYIAEFVHKMDKLFDCFNSSLRFHFKEVLVGISSKSCHIKFISDIRA
ncbi:MAG: hypothetical protein GY777_32475 [Candidatus Brocadiaceae bacterium]|nr:hypothetical protein [Candidatus Brocadiaceae bacterium]